MRPSPIPARAGWVLILGVLLLAIYGAFLGQPPGVTFDLDNLYGPLSQIHSLRDYFRVLWAGNRLWDFQPVRDLTLAFDLGFADEGPRTEYALNFLAFGFFLAGLYQALRRVTEERWVRATVVFILAVHPLMVGSVLWVAARKHLLSAAFIAWATAFWVRRPGRISDRWKAVLLYALSVFSQPIILFWPVWAFAEKYSASKARSKKNRTQQIAVWIVLAAVAGFAAWANFRYYAGPYALRSGQGKWAQTPDAHGVSILALGRYAWNWCFPFWLNPIYYVGAWQNLPGIALGVPFLFLSIRRWGWREAGIDWLFGILSLALVTLRMTNIFVLDCYALGSTFTVGWVIARILSRIKTARHKRTAIGVACFVVALFTLLSIERSKEWRSDEALWASTVEREASPGALQKLGRVWLTQGRYADARRILDGLLKWAPGFYGSEQEWAQAVYDDPALTLERKIEMFRLQHLSDPYALYYQAGAWAGVGRFREATEMYRALLHRRHEVFVGQIETIAAEAVYLCGKAGLSDCSSLRPKTQQLYGDDWDDARYQSRMKALNPTSG
jgi:hypothetical protein